MINSQVFDYVNVLDKAADASWLRNDAIANNIANVDTPDYKRQDVDFESALKTALQSANGSSMDSRVSSMDLNKLNVSTYTDNGDFSYRLDGNNVDIDTENAELASNQLKYEAIMQSVNQEFANLNRVMK